MQIQFTNKHIFFVLEGLWNKPDTLDYRFKARIYDLVLANSEEDFLQTFEIDVPTFVKCFKEVTIQREGVAAYINQEMLQSIVPQLMAGNNIAAVQNSIAALELWREEVYQVWYDSVYSPWRELNPEMPGTVYEDEPIPPTPPEVLSFNEYAQALMNLQEIDSSNKIIRDQKILNGKIQILA